ncbi:MAG: glycosyltransferase family 4 protein [Candidatus Dormibacteraeota bacterium]|nr:glycosyltransferase family 4 protein [Candidatus Dormibacteraeota bacterium]
MKVLLLSQFYPPVIGGEERHVQALARALAGRGHEVSVATLALDAGASTEMEDGIRIHRVRSSIQSLPRVFSDASRPYAPPAPDPGLAAALRRVVRAERPDVIHAHNWIVNSALPLRIGSPAALVLTLHDYGHACATRRLMRDGKPCSGPGLRRCLACAGRHYGAPLGSLATVATLSLRALKNRALDAVIAVSTAVAEGNRLPGSGVAFEVVPNFVDDSLWEAAGAPISDRHHPALPHEPFLLFAGDLSREKGLHLLLDAYGRLRRRPPLVLMGRLTESTPAQLPAGVVRLLDCTHDLVMEGFRRCEVAAAPSIWPDPCPTVVLEAMASGRPLVTTSIGGITDMVVDGKSGLRVTPGDAQGLATAVARLLDDPELGHRLGADGRARARDFTASRVVPRIEAVYERAVRARRRAAAPEVASPPGGGVETWR